MDGKNYDIDNLFKNAFDNFEVPPPANMWGKIESHLPLTDTEKLFKDALKNYEQEPSPEVWTNIQRELPISLTLRNGLMHLSRIAAVLLIAMFGFTFLQKTTWFSKEKSENHIVLQKETVLQQAFSDEKVEEEMAKINTDNVMSDEAILEEPIAQVALEETAPKGSFISDAPYLDGENTTKGGDVEVNIRPQTAVLNIDEINKRVQAGDDTRIPSAQLFQVAFVEDTAPKSDSLRIKKEKEDLLKNKSQRMEDVIAMESVLDFDGKMRRTKPSKPVASVVSAPLYMSLQGTSDAGFSHEPIDRKSVV